MQYLNEIKNKHITVLGLGVTGLGIVRFLLSQSIQPYVVDSRETPPVLQHGFECIALESYHHPASATSIRSSLQNKKTPAWLAPAVAHFIKENQLYLKSPLD